MRRRSFPSGTSQWKREHTLTWPWQEQNKICLSEIENDPVRICQSGSEGHFSCPDMHMANFLFLATFPTWLAPQRQEAASYESNPASNENVPKDRKISCWGSAQDLQHSPKEMRDATGVSPVGEAPLWRPQEIYWEHWPETHTSVRF